MIPALREHDRRHIREALVYSKSLAIVRCLENVSQKETQMKTLLLSVVLFAMAALLISTPAEGSSGKPMPFDAAASPTLTLILPKDGLEETRTGAPTALAFDANINYGREFSIMGSGREDSQDIDGYDVRWNEADHLEVAKLKGTTTKRGLITYGVTATTEETSEGYRMSFALVDKSQYTPFDLMRRLYTVESFEPAEARAQLLKPIVHFKTEIDSEFSPDSLRANFERLAEPARWNNVMARRFGLREQAQFYSLPSSIPGVTVRYVLDVFPYRNGAKAVISGQIVGAMTAENTVDMAQILSTTLADIKAIAAD